MEVRSIASDYRYTQWEVSVRPYSKETLKVLNVMANLIRDGWEILSTSTIHSTEQGESPPMTRYILSRTMRGLDARSFDQFEKEVEEEEGKVYI